MNRQQISWKIRIASWRFPWGGDLVDDWGCEHKVDLYEETLEGAVRFARKYPDTLWCLGNHDLSYMWDQYDHPGYSSYAEEIREEIRNKLIIIGIKYE